MATKKSTNCCNFPKPIDNDFLVGHDDILNEFMRAWNAREEYPIHPVWMLVGPRGIGKATLAYKIARHVYGNVGDFFILNLENNIDKNNNPKPDGKSISIYTVRALIERMHMSSMSGNWRVILIDSVDDLNTDSSNALLKTFEEPPKNTTFIFLTKDKTDVISTVVSRAQSFFVPSLQPENKDYSLVEGIIAGYWNFDKNRVLDIEDELLKLAADNAPEEIFIQMENYMFEILQSNYQNKTLFYRMKEDLKFVEEAMQQVVISKMNIKTVMENLCFKMFLK